MVIASGPQEASELLHLVEEPLRRLMKESEKDHGETGYLVRIFYTCRVRYSNPSVKDELEERIGGILHYPNPPTTWLPVRSIEGGHDLAIMILAQEAGNNEDD